MPVAANPGDRRWMRWTRSYEASAGALEPRRECREFVELRGRRALVSLRDPPDRSVGPRLPIGVEFGEVAWCRSNRGGYTFLADADDAATDFVVDALTDGRVGQPLIAVPADTIQHLASVPAHEDRRGRLLNGLRPRPDRVEINKPAVIGRLVLGPDRPDRFDPFPDQTEAASRIGAMVAHFLEVPAAANAEEKASTGEPVQARGLLGGDDRVTLGHEEDARAKQESVGRRGGRGESHEGIEAVPVLARHLAAVRIRCGAVSRYVGVLGEEQRVEAPLLDLARQPPGVDGIVSREEPDSQLHSASIPGRARAAFRSGLLFAVNGTAASVLIDLGTL